MSEYWPFVIIGLTTGSIYGLAAIGLVLTYRTSGIFNFAHGSIATVSAVLFFLMFEAHDWPWWLAFLDAVVIAGLLMGLLMERIGRRLVTANAAYKVVATLGLVLTVNWLAPTAIRIDNDLLDLPVGSGEARRAAWLPSGSFEVLGVVVGYDQLLVMVVGLVAAALLTVMLRRTRIGVQMRAVVDSPDLVDLTGVNPLAVRRAAWILGATFAGLSGALLAPQIGLNFAILTALVVQATGAAALGGFSNLGLAYFGGLVLGVAQALATKEFASETNWLSGVPTSLPVLFLFVALLVVPKHRLTDRYYPLPHRTRVARRVSPALKIGAYGLIGAVLIAIPFVADFLINWMRYLVYVLLFLSLGLLVKTSGQISLGHFAFAAVGAAAFHHFAASMGLPWLLALVLAGLACVPVGVIVSLPAIRLSGVFLALATYAFAVALQSLGYRTSAMFGTTTSGVAMPRPGIDWLSSDRGFYYVVLAIVALTVGVIIAIHRSRLGRLLSALGESPTALQTQGASISVTRVLLFCISAFMAGIAGALFGAAQFFVTGADFGSSVSVVLLVLVMIAPGGHPWFALTAAAGLAVFRGDYDLGEIGWLDLSLAFQLLFGVLAINMAMHAYRPRTMPASVSRLWLRVADRVAPPVLPEVAPAAAPAPVARAVVESAPVEHLAVVAGDGHGDLPAAGLVVEDLSVRYSALVAVDGVTLSAPTGRITGLVGPNGAGKSSLFDACTGLVRPAYGRVLLHGTDISHLDPAARARLGLGRTFQRVQLWNSLTVRQNVALGREGAMAGRNPWRQLRATRAERAEVEESAEAALTLCGISAMGSRWAGGLTTGQRRLVELARCLAGRYTMLLLDEPSSGLDTAETRRFGQVLELVVAQSGLGVLLVEHDMSLVMEICSRIHVLDVGRLIFEGAPAEIQASEEVRAAYLGSSEVEVGVGGR